MFLGAMQPYLQPFEGQEAAPNLSTFQGRSTFGESLEFLDRTVQQLVYECVAHALDGRCLLGREVEPVQGAGKLVAPDALGPIPELLDQRYHVQRREPAHKLEDGGPYHGLPRLGRRAPVARVAVHDRLQVVHVVDVGPIYVLYHRVHVPWDRDVYKEQRLLPASERSCDDLAPHHPLPRAGRAHHHIHIGKLLGEGVEAYYLTPYSLGERRSPSGGAIGDPELSDPAALE